MFQHPRFYVVGAFVGLVAAPTFSIAADTAADPSKTQPPIAYRADNAQEKLTSDTSKVTIERRADGSRSYHLNGEGMQTVTAQIGADGKLKLQCSDAADKAVGQPAASAAAAESNVHEQ